MNDDQKAAALSFALGFFEMVCNAEIPKSARYTKLENALDNCMKAINLYNWAGWQGRKIRAVDRLIDDTNRQIGVMFGDSRQRHRLARSLVKNRYRWIRRAA